MEGLTKRQQQVLDFITRFVDRHGYPPTLREISVEIGTAGTICATHHLEALERKGYVRRVAGTNRGITLVRPALPEMVQLPVVGVVNAGSPSLALEDIEGYYGLESGQARGGTFFLRVRGESMIEDGILNGDLALVRPQPDADNGDIVVVMVNSEATLKRFYREGGHIRLQPRNAAMAPIIVPPGEEVALVGKVVKIVRNIE